ncbi:hypothetical protein [Pontibacter chitinilyticus]|uniref:hypothetical protein n=1 Tax=Pontibacter chitinilyticus TaxID=2674989 RepID=UPI00321BFCCC
MKVLLIFMLALVTVSCVNSQGSTTIQYKNKSAEKSCRAGLYSMKIPKGFKLMTLVGGHDEKEKQYVYPDSAAIYVTNFRASTLNYNNIMTLGDSIADERLASTELKAEISRSLGKEYTPDTLVLHGITDKGLYWKDIKVGCISIGYTNVPEHRKSEFNKALDSFKLR